MAQTTIVPFATLPACATSCGSLFDANGGCVPPAVPTADANTYASCFCGHAKVSALAGGAVDVCNGNCQADGLSSIHNWFTSFCGNKANSPQTTGTTGTMATATGTKGASNAGSGNTQQGGGDWLSNHWKWVIMIVVIFVAIVGIWVGAFIWRRRYLRKKDRMYELGKGLPSNVAVNTQGQLVGAGVNRGSAQPMLPPSGGVINADFLEKPKKERKRWNVGERT